MTEFTVTPLGTNGWMPGEGRETMCAAVELGDALILLDCGTGIRRLRDANMRAAIDRARRIYILLSHYHLDHLIGLIFLPGLLAGKDVCIAGPGPELSDTTLREALDGMARFPYFAHDIASFPMTLELYEIRPGTQHLPHFTLTARRQDHTHPSAGLRIDDALAYATDTAPDAGTIELARGADLLIHEGWLTIADYEEARRTNALVGRGHTHAAGAARIALDAGVRRLALTHLNPGYSEARLSEMESEARVVFTETSVMKDLKPI